MRLVWERTKQLTEPNLDCSRCRCPSDEFKLLQRIQQTCGCRSLSNGNVDLCSLGSPTTTKKNKGPHFLNVFPFYCPHELLPIGNDPFHQGTGPSSLLGNVRTPPRYYANARFIPTNLQIVLHLSPSFYF
ncbi:MAG: hypothetical protein M2R45_01882 [Verrucomicrobia subdivision 3 bacterium]|nr:hypothetical protein [Limisphaerales bacterium]MCS1415682.1 hypothetical protein [Limisphaerales bacterium]